MEFDKLNNEDVSLKDDCNLCKEASLEVGTKTEYGAIIIYSKDGWFATLSPKTGGDEKDFSIQLMPLKHLTNFSQLETHPELAKGYGIAFSKLSFAITKILADENPDFKASSESREKGVSVATYGKCTTWKEKKEHLHLKIFPFRGNIGQPYTVDSSFGRKEIFKENGKEFVKMNPIKKVLIEKERFEELSKKLIGLSK